MRDIKFRAWIKDHMIKDCYPWGLMNHEGISIMQYTGLKDHNDKEIYEGDIVSHFHNLYEIYFDQGMFLAKNIPSIFIIKAIERLSNLLLGGYIQIIGNIYENPELLNDT